MYVAGGREAAAPAALPASAPRPRAPRLCTGPCCACALALRHAAACAPAARCATEPEEGRARGLKRATPRRVPRPRIHTRQGPTIQIQHPTRHAKPPTRATQPLAPRGPGCHPLPRQRTTQQQTAQHTYSTTTKTKTTTTKHNNTQHESKQNRWRDEAVCATYTCEKCARAPPPRPRTLHQANNQRQSNNASGSLGSGFMGSGVHLRRTPKSLPAVFGAVAAVLAL
jgi:hypothetical protein